MVPLIPLALAAGLGVYAWRWFMQPDPEILAELVRSSTADRLRVDNRPQPGSAAEANLARTARIVAKVRAEWPAARVTSGYRSPAVNQAVGGAANSLHAHGRAVDLAVPGVAPEDVGRWALASFGDELDEVIFYAPSRGGHLHLGLSDGSKRAKKALMYAPPEGGYRRVA